MKGNKDERETVRRSGSNSNVVGLVRPGSAARDSSRTPDRISFPIGEIDRHVDKLRRAWGVKQMPHLVLTDREHVVTDEGFGLDELDEKIKEVQNENR